MTAEPAPEALPAVAADGASTELLAARGVLTARAESYARGARADSTWAAYERQWHRFETWCQGVGERALPAEALTVARFLADHAPAWRAAVPTDPPAAVVAGQVLVAEGMRPGTLAGYLAAISVVHQSAGHDNPTRTEPVRPHHGRHPSPPRRHPRPPSRRRAARPAAADPPHPAA